ncbi:sigma 54-interacting transcriptional regulator [Halobacillus litoralis]|uniref:sigma 54-interacting transcriptional regulator n=1 Tax=Halobacillus litoralis TaxID=45668 RepID=UPI001CD42F95|nr:sigma 54-interacting transcriptional regulator [Halobacillus litoralis]MCA1023840.1 sigma 54-interacting transcriptional regulator [Halobacillus litoralis]
MIKIALVVPEDNFIKDAHGIFKRHNRTHETTRVREEHSYQLIEIVVKGEQLQSLSFDCDVIVSRGILAQALKNNHQRIPVVDIPVPGYDLIKIIHQAKSEFGNKQIAVIGSQNMIFGVESLSEIMEVPIKSYILNNYDQYAELVDTALKDGCEIVLGGLKACNYSSQIGVKNKLIQTGEESFWQSITEAKRLAVYSRREQEKAKSYKAIMDYSYEGIIATDFDGNITVFNMSAYKLLNVTKEKATGHHVRSIINKSKLRDLLLNNTEVNNEIVRYLNNNFTVRKVNIKLDGLIIGRVVTFQDISGIQSMEGEIRKKIYARGHVAKYHFEDIFYKSKVMDHVIRVAQRFSQTQSNILIYGETGVGKEVFAQSIHNNSNRRNAPFVAVNCGALPENLLESELFGYVKGAFTGASKEGKAGVFELAHNGTIFLDEIGEMPLKLQTRLLRVLQEREITRLGGDRVTPVDVRVVAATNQKLTHLIDTGEFRQDLYYRLEVLKIHIPPLSDRKEDVEIFIDHYINEFQSRECRSIYITPNAKEKLKQYYFPGNVRQLQNVCERLFVLCNDKIDAHDVESVLLGEEEGEKPFPIEEENSSVLSGKESYEKQYYRKIMEECKYNRSEAAKRLGISRTTLWRRLKELKLNE